MIKKLTRLENGTLYEESTGKIIGIGRKTNVIGPKFLVIPNAKRLEDFVENAFMREEHVDELSRKGVEFGYVAGEPLPLLVKSTPHLAYPVDFYLILPK